MNWTGKEGRKCIPGRDNSGGRRKHCAPVIKLLSLFTLLCDAGAGPYKQFYLPSSQMLALSVEGNKVVLQGYKDGNTLLGVGPYYY